MSQNTGKTHFFLYFSSDAVLEFAHKRLHNPTIG